jgi:hypothetical protein
MPLPAPLFSFSQQQVGGSGFLCSVGDATSRRSETFDSFSYSTSGNLYVRAFGHLLTWPKKRSKYSIIFQEVNMSYNGFNVVICGGGNAAHVMAGLVPTVEGVGEVSMLTTFADEAERIRAAAATQGGVIRVRRNKEGPNGTDIFVEGKPTRVKEYSWSEAFFLSSKVIPFSLAQQITNDPSVVATADVVVFVVPAFAHAGYLEAIKPHLRRGGANTPGGRVILGAFPAESGFDLQVNTYHTFCVKKIIIHYKKKIHVHPQHFVNIKKKKY